MFYRKCGQTIPHEAHTYTQHWVKKDLPHLLHPEKYPPEWDAKYKCPGISAPSPLAVEYLHEDCTPCEACADMAADQLYKFDKPDAVWRELGPGDVILHMAEVSRL